MTVTFSFFSFQPSTAYADVVYVKSGETMKGLVVEEHRDRIVLSTESGEKTFWRTDIDEIFYDDAERNYLYLGRQALEAGNFSLAKGFFRKALQIYPEFEEASDALGRLADLEAKQASGPPPTNPVESLELKWGLVLEATAERPLVKKVNPGSFAERAGIRSGDPLVQAWGESLTFAPLTEVAKALLGPSGSTLKLTVERTVPLPAATPKDTQWPGTVLTTERLGLTVQEIRPKSVSAILGILPKDRIVKLDERSTRYLPLGEAQRMIQEAKEQGVRFTIHRDLFIKRE